MVTYLQSLGTGNRVCEINAWDPRVVSAVREHPLFGGHGDEHGYADANFSLEELAVVASDVLPEEYVRETNATGTPAQAAQRLREYLVAGVDELILHGSSPHQPAPVITELTATDEPGGDRPSGPAGS